MCLSDVQHGQNQEKLKMNSQQFSRLKEEQARAILETDIKIEKWEQFRSDYEALKSRLKSLPDKVTHDVMVPFGSLAFMPGKLVHTNEVLVLLGDNWFAERSAKQAAAIVSRRLKDVESQIDGLKQQKKILSPRLEFTTDLEKSAVEQGVVDITEEYDEEKEKRWKEQHRKRVQELKKKKKVTKDKDGGWLEQAGHREELTDEQLWARLDELERIETERNELQMLDTEDEIHLSLPPESDDDDDEDDESPLTTSDSSEQEDSRRITFKHTQVDDPEGKETESCDKIESPRDIYQRFCDVNPKSILKSNKTDEGQKEKGKVKKKVKMKEDISVEESRKRRGIRQGPLAFSGTVVEKNTDFQMKNIEDNNSDETVLNNPSSDMRRQCKSVTEGVGVKEAVQPGLVSMGTTQPKRVSKFKAGRQRNIDPS